MSTRHAVKRKIEKIRCDEEEEDSSDEESSSEEEDEDDDEENVDVSNLVRPFIVFRPVVSNRISSLATFVAKRMPK